MNMCTIYYNIARREWYQCEEPKGLLFGKEDTILTYVAGRQNNSLPFPVNRDGNRVGPLIGILTAPSSDNTFIGNLQNLKSIVLALQDRGALGIIITPHSLQEHPVQCFTFYKPLMKWIKLEVPLPTTVYNRIPYRPIEETQLFNAVVSFLKMKGIPFFNPYFFSKWNVYQILKRNQSLISFLPETILLTQLSDLESMLIKHQDIYLKRASGSKGIGIYRLKKERNKIIVETPNGKQIYRTLASFWEKNDEEFAQEDFILQKAIPYDTYDGKRYDLRLLCHYDYDSTGHSISGIGVRLSGESEVTTHVPNGGTIIPYERVRPRFDEALLNRLVYIIGKELNKQIEEFVGEFSIDLGRSVDGGLFIYEINSKPMVFDETHIRKKGLENLTKLLIMKATITT
ncbi:YheC/YheD family protein [Bacillus sinesaloumensis]|uniref:YheC/YheD family endospore coat-associated protein n=1 Tax=Litchfieldia sinesaloumensis TaxID=1926280 RepID=UPI000988372B|nr:YheC/YheD family protein [Bacillus sinesaloumensis]